MRPGDLKTPAKTNDRLAVRQAIVSLSRRNRFRCVLDGVTDVAQDLADLIAQEDEGNDRDDRDKREDQRVLRETLASSSLRRALRNRLRRAMDGLPK